MQIPITDDLKAIFTQILDEGRSEGEWVEIESDDMFQSERFDGGFDATERAFCFSYYDDNDDEFWFQLTLADIDDLLTGRKTVLEGRPAE